MTKMKLLKLAHFPFVPLDRGIFFAECVPMWLPELAVVSFTRVNDCFFTAVAAGLIDQSPQDSTASDADTLIIKCFMRTSLRWKSFENGMAVGDIQEFEKKNRALDFGVNVFAWDAAEETVFALYQPKWMKNSPSRFVNIMLLTYVHPITKRKSHHYMFINNLPMLFQRNYPCEICLNVFSTRQAHERHQELCGKNSPQETIIPEEGEVIEFKNYKNQVLFPVFGTLDFEACMHDPKDNSDSGKVIQLKEQVPTTYSLFIRDIFGKTLFQKNVEIIVTTPISIWEQRTMRAIGREYEQIWSFLCII